MKYVTGWRAKRAGGRITVYGRIDGKDTRVSNVDEIKPEGGRVVATDKNGDRFELAI